MLKNTNFIMQFSGLSFPPNYEDDNDEKEDDVDDDVDGYGFLCFLCRAL